ncbi:MAG: hypothetical protein EHM87_17825 [Burkholderiales bacterium]|nr:MAG: hypothetical protein EHM87_17825 [Burkholderiales bacterium]
MPENDSVERVFTILAERMRDPSPVFEELGEIMIESIQTNFEQGGRPQQWKASKRAETTGGRTLIDKGGSGGLLGSLHRNPDPNKAIVAAGKVYAAMMHFGATKGQFGTIMAQIPQHSRTRNGKTYTVSSHQRQTKVPWGNIPARPFMMFQDEDVPEILNAMTRYLFTFSGNE